MKKSKIILYTATSLFSVIFFKSHAQFAMNSNRIRPTSETPIFYESGAAGTGEKVNTKAEKNFARAYKQATAVEWLTLQDKLLMCRFYMNDIPYRAFYTRHGKWINTTYSYDDNRLDKAVYEEIKSIYNNSEIVFVNQIDVNGSRTIYIVEIQDKKSIEKVSIENDDLEIVKELEKK